MPLQLTAPLEKEFILDKLDEKYGNTGDPTRIVVRQATVGDVNRRNELSRVISEWNARDQNLVIRSTNELFDLMIIREVFQTLAECNIMDADGKPMFAFNTTTRRLAITEDLFTKKWNQLPPDVAEEIHKRVIEVNPDWSPLANPA